MFTNSQLKYFSLFLFILLLSACEDVIVLELEDESPRVIIEASINATEGTAHAIISRSNGFYEEAIQVRVPDAKVTLINEQGQEWLLDVNSDQTYSLSAIPLEEGASFTLSVDLDDELYTASTVVPSAVTLLNIDTLTFTPPFGGGNQSFIQMFSEWQDVEGVDNFYRLKTYTNGVNEPGSYFIYTDLNADGNRFYRPLMQIFEPGNLYKIELLSMDPASYDYFQQLSTIQSQGGGSSVPFNPAGNFDNDALGYFGIYFSSSIEVQL